MDGGVTRSRADDGSSSQQLVEVAVHGHTLGVALDGRATADLHSPLGRGGVSLGTRPHSKEGGLMKAKFFPITVAAFLSFAVAALGQEGQGYGAKPGKETKEKTKEQKAETGKSVTLTGEVIGLSCRLADPGKAGEKHHCTAACLKGFATITDEATGEAYVAYEAGQKSAVDRLAEWAGQRVKVTGKAKEAKGVKILVLDTVAKAEGAKPAATAAEASAPKPREATIKGTVVNVACAVDAISRGEAHTCDAKCLEGKALLGILDPDAGKIFIALAAPDEKGERKLAHTLLRPLVGSRVSVTGKVTGNLIEISKAEKA